MISPTNLGVLERDGGTGRCLHLIKLGSDIFLDALLSGRRLARAQRRRRQHERTLMEDVDLNGLSRMMVPRAFITCW